MQAVERRIDPLWFVSAQLRHLRDPIGGHNLFAINATLIHDQVTYPDGRITRLDYLGEYLRSTVLLQQPVHVLAKLKLYVIDVRREIVPAQPFFILMHTLSSTWLQ